MAVIECPFCFEILEVEPPDRLHSAFSFAKPIPKIFHHKVTKKNYKCNNPECNKPISVFWYAPLEYFSRI